MPTINMLSSAEKVKGQGVLSAYEEQVCLVKNGLKDNYKVIVNKPKLCDITHYHTIDFKYFLCMPFAKIKGRTVAYVHFVPETVEDSINLPLVIKKIFYKYIITFYKGVDHLVVVNPYFTDVLAGYGIDKSKITYIPNFVAEDKFYKYDDETKKNLRAKFDIPEDKFVVLGVGQVQNRKGIMDFIEVAKRFPDIQFLWAGGFSFGSISDGYKSLKKEVENPPENVRFIGIIEREKMNDIYNVADLMFLPSYQELFPMAVLEAMTVKMPILLRDLDIYPNILFDYYLKGNNVEEFANVIGKLQQDSTFYKNCCDKSWEGHQYYSKKYVLKLWKQFYDRVYLENLQMKVRSN